MAKRISKTQHGRTQLHEAAAANNYNRVQQLLSNRANVHARDQHGQMPLHYAAAANSLQAARILLAHGANVRSKNTFGETPLDFATGKTKQLLHSHSRDNHRSQDLQRGRRDSRVGAPRRGNHQSQGLQQDLRDIRGGLDTVKDALLKLTRVTGERLENIEMRQDNQDGELEDIKMRQDDLDQGLRRTWVGVGIIVIFLLLVISAA